VDQQEAEPERSSLVPFTFPGTYQDSAGQQDISWQVRPQWFPGALPGFEIGTVVRGVECSGPDFDALDPASPSDARAAGLDVGSTGELTACTLSGDIPCALEDNGQLRQDQVRFWLELKPRDLIRRGDNVKKNLRASAQVRGETFEAVGESFEEALLGLEAKLPAGARLVCCVTCQFSDYSPLGSGLTGMYCHRDAKEQYLAVRSKDDYWDVPATEHVMETHRCAEYAQRVHGTGYRG
jgi:hypothetical protein